MKPIWYKCWLDEFFGVPILSEFAVSDSPVAITTLKVVEVAFDDQPGAFSNINTPDELRSFENAP